MSYKAFGIILPDELVGTIDRYIQSGIPTGGFLQAIIENNLKEAVGRADHENIHRIPAIVSYLYNKAPIGCWGKRDSFSDWIEVGGFKGLMASKKYEESKEDWEVSPDGEWRRQ